MPRTADAADNRAEALAYWTRHPGLAIGTLQQQVYAVGPLRLMAQGWEITCPEAMATRV